jgi:hypothetical protein
MSFILVGCVDYRSTLDAVRHQTRFAYNLIKPTRPFGPPFGGFKPAGIIEGLAMGYPVIGGASVD